MTRPRWRLGLALGLGLLSGLSLAYNTATRPEAALAEMRATRRYWEDLTIGASRYLQQDAGPDVPSVSVGSGPGVDLRHGLHRNMKRGVSAQHIRPWEFWRTVKVKRFLVRERVVPRDYDDPGRPALLGFGFRILGGVAPYLPAWLGALLCIPLLAWLAWELADAGLMLAAAILPLALAGWAHLVDVLALPYSAAGFYLVATLTLVTFTVYAVLGRGTSRVGLGARLLLAGTAFAVCVLCRGSAMTLLPAFLLATVLAVRRVLAPTSVAKLLLLVLAGAAVFLAPHLALRQARHHAVWGDLWEGLGDFDSSKGHVWSDVALRQLLRREGMRLHQNVGVEWESDRSEAITRRIVLGHIREDPLWFATILAKRIPATLTQWKLWAWEPRSGRPYTPSTRENEGTIDRYYKMAATGDTFGFGRFRFEVPMPLLIAPAALLLAAALISRRTRRLPAARETLLRATWVLACVALGTATLPLAFSTGALEMQAFVVVYLVGAALGVEALWSTGG